MDICNGNEIYYWLLDHTYRTYSYQNPCIDPKIVNYLVVKNVIVTLQRYANKSITQTR